MSDESLISPSALLASVGAYHLRRQEVLAGNLANAETPGFSARELSFESYLSELFESRQTPAPESEVIAEVIEGADGNSVGLEETMARLTANHLRQSTILELLSRQLGAQRYAASDGATS